MEKLEPKFEQGIWLGVCSRTDEAIIGTAGGIVRAGTVKRQAIEDAWKSTSLLSVAITPWTMGRQNKRRELTVENDDAEKLIKVDDTEVAGNPRRFRITREDIEKVGFSDGCMGCNAMHASKPAQRHSEYCRRRVQENLKGTEEGRQRLEKAEERFTEALVQAGEIIETLGMRAAMHRDEATNESAAAQAGDSEARRPPVRGA